PLTVFDVCNPPFSDSEYSERLCRARVASDCTSLRSASGRDVMYVRTARSSTADVGCWSMVASASNLSFVSHESETGKGRWNRGSERGVCLYMPEHTTLLYLSQG